MEAMLKALLAASPVTALAVAQIEDGALTACHAFGEFDGKPFATTTVFPVASLTKPVFSYGILQLVQQGLIVLDRPLVEYLPAPYQDDEATAKITARHALTHTTGYPNWRDKDGLRASFDPGTRFSYSSEGLNYLQFVAEHVLEMPFATYLHEHVFTPFGMTNSELGTETPETLPPFVNFLHGNLLANGAFSLRTTIEDYARFMLEVLNPAPADENHLHRTLHTHMLTPQVNVGVYPDLHWGLGVGLQYTAGDLSFWHWGGRAIPTTLNLAVGYPQQKKALIIFTDQSEGLYLARNIVREVWGLETMPALDWLLPAKRWRPDGIPPADS